MGKQTKWKPNSNSVNQILQLSVLPLGYTHDVLGSKGLRPLSPALSAPPSLAHSLPHRLRPAPHHTATALTFGICHLQYGRVSTGCTCLSLTPPGHASQTLTLLHGVRPQLLFMAPSILVFPVHLQLHLYQCLSWPLSHSERSQLLSMTLHASKMYHLADQVWLPAWAGLDPSVP